MKQRQRNGALPFIAQLLYYQQHVAMSTAVKLSTVSSVLLSATPTTDTSDALRASIAPLGWFGTSNGEVSLQCSSTNMCYNTAVVVAVRASNLQSK